jgi:hypothetical protein
MHGTTLFSTGRQTAGASENGVRKDEIRIMTDEISRIESSFKIELWLDTIFVALSVIITFYALAQCNIVRASEQHSVDKRKGVIFEVKDEVIEEKVTVAPSRTAIQQKQLEAFVYEIFEPPLPGLQRNRGAVTPNILSERFGEPHSRSSQPDRHHDPVGPPKNEDLVWHYLGMTLDMVAKVASRVEERERPMWITAVEISSPNYILKHGLRIGQPWPVYLSVLGPPTYRYQYLVNYESETVFDVKTGAIITRAYQVEMKVDKDDTVRKIEWSWWSH